MPEDGHSEEDRSRKGVRRRRCREVCPHSVRAAQTVVSNFASSIPWQQPRCNALRSGSRAHLALECLDLAPFLDDGLLLLGKVNRHLGRNLGLIFRSPRATRCLVVRSLAGFEQGRQTRSCLSSSYFFFFALATTVDSLQEPWIL